MCFTSSVCFLSVYQANFEQLAHQSRDPYELCHFQAPVTSILKFRDETKLRVAVDSQWPWSYYVLVTLVYEHPLWISQASISLALAEAHASKLPPTLFSLTAFRWQ